MMMNLLINLYSFKENNMFNYKKSNTLYYKVIKFLEKPFKKH